MSDTMTDLDHGGLEWWEDGRQVTSLALWAADHGANAREIVSIYEAPWENSFLWQAANE